MLIYYKKCKIINIELMKGKGEFSMKSFLELMGFAIVVIIIYNLASKYVLPKVKINKWILLTVAILVFVLGSLYPLPAIWNLLPSGVFVILLLWFFDLQGWGARNRMEKRMEKKFAKKNAVIMKPKAKPNRVKNKK